MIDPSVIESTRSGSQAVVNYQLLEGASETHTICQWGHEDPLGRDMFANDPKTSSTR